MDAAVWNAIWPEWQFKNVIGRGAYAFASLEQLAGWETILGLAFENLVVNNFREFLPRFGLDRTVLLSAALVLVSFGLFAFKGLNYGIDFTGGNVLTVAFQQDKLSAGGKLGREDVEGLLAHGVVLAIVEDTLGVLGLIGKTANGHLAFQGFVAVLAKCRQSQHQECHHVKDFLCHIAVVLTIDYYLLTF